MSFAFCRPTRPIGYGPVRSDHILFIAAGAFHLSKPSDLMPELQGRFPIRVELTDLNKADFLRILTEPKHSLTRIDLIHPDPWPKRRHWKRRFVQDATIAAMARVLKPDGEFRFVSDISDYCTWTLAHFSRAPDFVWTAECASDWRVPWPDYTMTRYGRKAEREGSQATYLRFKKIG